MKAKAAIGAVVVAGVGTILVLKHHALTKLRDENQALQQQVEQLTRQAEARLSQSNLVAQASNSASLGQKHLQDLNRLRGGMGALRPQTNELAKLQAENRQSRSVTDKSDDPAEAEFKQETERRVTHLKPWSLTFLMYAKKHNDRFPETWEQAAGQLTVSPADKASFLSFATNDFDIVHHGAAYFHPEAILFWEKQARRSPKGEWVRVYGFADGSADTHTEPDAASFEAWEKQRMIGTQ